MVNLSDLTVTCVLAEGRAVMSPINKWVATSVWDVTHSRAAVLSPLMTINVNRTISAHPLKCLTVGWAGGESIVHTYPKIDSDTERLALILTVSLISFVSHYSLSTLNQ